MSFESRVRNDLGEINRQLAHANEQLREVNLAPGDRAALHSERAATDRAAMIFGAPVVLYGVVWLASYKVFGPGVNGGFIWVGKFAIKTVVLGIPLLIAGALTFVVLGYAWRAVQFLRGR